MSFLLACILSIFPATRSAAASKQTAAVSGAVTLACSTKKHILVVRIGGQDVKTYDVAVGTKKYPTPMGTFSIRHIVWNPAWQPPPGAKWAKGKQATAPGDPKNPMKIVKIFFRDPDYYIHGTDDEDSLGGAASHGCIRMATSDVEELGRFIMDHAGLVESDEWYQQVMSGTRPADVKLPVSVPIVIGP
jgi:lipoprotein-anchoring transpeptidase ErfK/SrfK